MSAKRGPWEGPRRERAAYKKQPFSLSSNPDHAAKRLQFKHIRAELRSRFTFEHGLFAKTGSDL
jgi:hypothetical protein